LQIDGEKYIIIIAYDKMAWMKAAIQFFVKRAGGWCKPVRDWIFPLSELLVINQKAGNLYITFVEGVGL